MFEGLLILTNPQKIITTISFSSLLSVKQLFSTVSELFLAKVGE